MKHISELLSAERIVILDASTGKVFVRFVPQSMIELDGDEILEYFAPKLGLSVSDCTFMVVNDDDFINDDTQSNDK